MTRIEHERRLMDLLAVASDDEVKVIARFVQRIHNARREYGPLRIKRDTRDYRHEAAAEAFDALAYLCMEDVRRGVEQEPQFEWLNRELRPEDVHPGAMITSCAHDVGIMLPCKECEATHAAGQRVRTILKQREG